MPDSQLCAESKTEPIVAKKGGHHAEKTYTGRGDTAHTFLMKGTIWVGTPHNIRGVHRTYLLDDKNN